MIDAPPTPDLAHDAREGTRRLALARLAELAAARAAWHAVTRDAATNGDDASDDRDATAVSGARTTRADALHAVRVAQRRLRETLRAFRDVFGRPLDRADRRHLRAIGKATSARRDRDVREAWLREHAATLSDDAARGAAAWAGAAEPADAHGAQDDAAADRRAARAGARAVEKTLRKHFDRHAERWARRIARYTTVRDARDTVPETPLGVVLATALRDAYARVLTRADAAQALFAAEAGRAPRSTDAEPSVAARVQTNDDVWSREETRDDWRAPTALDAASRQALHALRLAVKRVRALLAPWRGDDDAFRIAYDEASAIQDALGAVNDEATFADAVRDGAADEPLRAFADTLAQRAGVRAAAVIAEWRGIPSLGAAAHAFEVAARGNVEIERKFLLRAVPAAIAARPYAIIVQGWLPGEQLRERLRRVVHEDGRVSCWRTVKLGVGLRRTEVEEPTDPALFEALWPHTAARRVQKRRYSVRDGALVWEIDVFTDRELVLAEVELPSEETEVECPPWLAPYVVRDVTGESAFVNANLAASVHPRDATAFHGGGTNGAARTATSDVTHA